MLSDYRDLLHKAGSARLEFHEVDAGPQRRRRDPGQVGARVPVTGMDGSHESAGLVVDSQAYRAGNR
jgi:hypothetical protein